MTTGSKVFGPTKDFPELTQPSGKPMLPRSAGYGLGGGGGAERFTDLLDTFDSYTGKAGLLIRVRMAEDGLEAVTGGIIGAFTDLSDTFASYNNLAGKVLAVNENEDGIEAIDILVINQDGDLVIEGDTIFNGDIFMNGNIDMNYYQIQNLVIENVYGVPVTLVEGLIWYNSETHVMQYFDGTDVIDMSAPDDDFHTLSFSYYDPSFELLIYNTDTNSYGKILFTDILNSDEGWRYGFRTLHGNRGTRILDTDTYNIGIMADDSTLEFYTDPTVGVAYLLWLGQLRNTFLAGPTTGSNQIPTFRTLVDDDMPASYNPTLWDTVGTFDISGYVPYIGATDDIDLGNHNLDTNGTISADSVTIVGLIEDATEAATKGYVDGLVFLSIFWVEPCEDIVSALPGGTPAAGLRYILSTDGHINVADGAGNWTDLGATATGTTCFVKADVGAPDNEVGIYTYNGAAWVFIGLQVIHNDTIAIQGGIPNEYYHLDAEELARVVNPADTTTDGYLTSADWNYFASKTDGDHDHTSGPWYWNHAAGGYEAYATQQQGAFDIDTVDPIHTARLNYDGWFYAAVLFSEGTAVSIQGHHHDDVDIDFYDNTIGDVSTAAHGYAPKLSNDPTTYLDGEGNWTVPAGGGGSSVWERNAGLGTINPITHTDKVAIGSDDPGVYMLHVTGNIYCTQFVTVNSDVRTKDISGEVSDVLENLKYITPIKFSYKTDEIPTEHFGFSAQEVNGIFPSVSLYDEETDTYGIDAIGLAALAIKGLKELNNKLESEVIDLQLKLKFLKRNFLNAKTSDN